MPRDLTVRQKAFVEEYLVDLNATQAAIRAGYAKKGASVQGAQLLANPKVAAAVQKKKNARSERTEITADRVLQEFARIGFADIGDIVKWEDGTVKLVEFDTLTPDQRAALSEVSQKTTGEITVKMHPKVAALQDIAKHLGMFVERHDIKHSGDASVLVRYELPKTDRK